jgi:hypothetical protein
VFFREAMEGPEVTAERDNSLGLPMVLMAKEAMVALPYSVAAWSSSTRAAPFRVAKAAKLVQPQGEVEMEGMEEPASPAPT